MKLLGNMYSEQRIDSWTFGSSGEGELQLSVILPVFNQANSIKEVLEKLIRSLSLPCELIVICDGCEDDSLAKTLAFFESLCFPSNPHIKSVAVYSWKFSRFETYCDFFGIRVAKAKYCLEVQADMFLEDRGFDARMLSVMTSLPQLLVLSGRGVEPLAPIIANYKKTLGSDVAPTSFLSRYVLIALKRYVKALESRFHKSQRRSSPKNGQATPIPLDDVDSFILTGRAGRLGRLIERPNEDRAIDCIPVYIGETIMRGPILINVHHYYEVECLNSRAFFLGYDDHDLCARALMFGLEVAYTPVHFSSPLTSGSSRAPRTLLQEILLFANLLRIRKYRSHTALMNPNVIQMTSMVKRRVIFL